VPDDQKEFTQINAELAKLWKPIIERKPAPADADDGKDIKGEAPIAGALALPVLRRLRALTARSARR
jgi:hypothetical protein